MKLIPVPRSREFSQKLPGNRGIFGVGEWLRSPESVKFPVPSLLIRELCRGRAVRRRLHHPPGSPPKLPLSLLAANRGRHLFQGPGDCPLESSSHRRVMHTGGIFQWVFLFLTIFKRWMAEKNSYRKRNCKLCRWIRWDDYPFVLPRTYGNFTPLGGTSPRGLGGCDDLERLRIALARKQKH